MRWSRPRSRIGRRRRVPRSAGSSRCSARSTRPASTRTVIIRKYGLPDAHSDAAVAEAGRLGRFRPRPRPQGPDGFPSLADGDDRRRARSRLRRRACRSIGCRTATSGWPCTSPTCRTTSTEDSALDTEAYERATSVYFPERAVHMFPSELSTGLCSLNPHVDRLVQSCLMEVDRRTGAVVRYEMHDGVIHSDARMTYTDVNAILTDRNPEVIDAIRGLRADVRAACTSCSRCCTRDGGAADRSTSICSESEIVLDDQGRVEAVVAAERNVAHRLIEEFMLLANETVAAHLETHSACRRSTGCTRGPTRSRSRRSTSSSRRWGIRCRATAARSAPADFQGSSRRFGASPKRSPSRSCCCARCRRRATTRRTSATSVWRPRRTRTSRRRFAAIRISSVHRVLRESRHGVDDERRDELAERFAGDRPAHVRARAPRERRRA